jgi:hypothetical protein
VQILLDLKSCRISNQQLQANSAPGAESNPLGVSRTMPTLQTGREVHGRAVPKWDSRKLALSGGEVVDRDDEESARWL